MKDTHTGSTPNRTLASALKNAGILGSKEATSALEDIGVLCKKVEAYYANSGGESTGKKCTRPKVAEMKRYCEEKEIEVRGHAGRYKTYAQPIRGHLLKIYEKDVRAQRALDRARKSAEKVLVGILKSARKALTRIHNGVSGIHSFSDGKGSSVRVEVFKEKGSLLPKLKVLSLAGPWKERHGCMRPKDRESMVFLVSLILNREELSGLRAYKQAVIGNFLKEVIDPLMRKEKPPRTKTPTTTTSGETVH